MDNNDVIATLRSHAPELRNRGVRHAALFGSLARGQAKSSSDIDILIELEPAASIDLLDYIGITHYLADLFPVPVDVSNRNCLKPHIRAVAERDAVYAF